MTLSQELKHVSVIRRCAEHFGLIGDLTRMKICWLLSTHPELSVGEIARVLRVSPSVVSHSLRRLRQYHLVESRRAKKQILYRFANTRFNRLVKKSLTTP